MVIVFEVFLIIVLTVTFFGVFTLFVRKIGLGILTVVRTIWRVVIRRQFFPSVTVLVTLCWVVTIGCVSELVTVVTLIAVGVRIKWVTVLIKILVMKLIFPVGRLKPTFLILIWRSVSVWWWAVPFMKGLGSFLLR